MKAVLEFNLPEEQEEFDDALNGTKNRHLLEEVWDNVFRPYHKHGYNNEELEKLLENKKCVRVLEILEEIYRKTTIKE